MNQCFVYFFAAIAVWYGCSKNMHSQAKFEVLTFHTDSISVECRFVGELLGGARWRDSNGLNILLVSQNFKTGVDAGIQEIFGYNYVFHNGKYHLLWKSYDYSENVCDPGEGLVSHVEVDDLDDDGLGESAFIYNVEGACDVSPRLFTLVFHSGELELKAHGYKRGQVGETTHSGDFMTDSSFESAPIIYSEYCRDFWQRTLE